MMGLRSRLCKRLQRETAILHSSLEQVIDRSGFDSIDFCWRLPGKKAPCSCTDEEGLLIYDLIAHNQLTHGFEIATAFGFSAVYAGLAFKQTGGTLNTLDCYIEESTDDCAYGKRDLEQHLQLLRPEIERGNLPQGMAFAKKMLQQLQLEGTVHLHVGISPNDIPACIDHRPVDFVLIDGGHHGEQPMQDWLAIQPFVSEKCAILFHDDSASFPAVKLAVSAAEEFLGVKGVQLSSRAHMTLVSRNLQPDTEVRLKQICVRNRAWIFPKRLERYFRRFKLRLAAMVGRH